MAIKQGFRTSEVVKLTGLTPRQLDHWDRTGLFRPSLAHAEGRGSARFYSFLDVVQLRVVKKLLDAGLSTKKLRKCLTFLRENLRRDSFSDLSLVTNGKDIFMVTENHLLALDLLKSGQVVWAVNVEVVAKEIEKKSKVGWNHNRSYSVCMINEVEI